MAFAVDSALDSTVGSLRGLHTRHHCGFYCGLMRGCWLQCGAPVQSSTLRGSSARFQCESLLRDSTVGLQCVLRVDSFADHTKLATVGPHCGSPTRGSSVGSKIVHCTVYCSVDSTVCSIAHSTDVLCTSLLALLRSNVESQWGPPLWGSPMGNVKPLGAHVEIRCGFQCEVRFGSPRMGSIAVFQSGAPMWGSSVGLQCEIPVYNRLCSGLYWIV